MFEETVMDQIGDINNSKQVEKNLVELKPNIPIPTGEESPDATRDSSKTSLLKENSNSMNDYGDRQPGVDDPQKRLENLVNNRSDCLSTGASATSEAELCRPYNETVPPCNANSSKLGMNNPMPLSDLSSVPSNNHGSNRNDLSSDTQSSASSNSLLHAVPDRSTCTGEQPSESTSGRGVLLVGNNSQPVLAPHDEDVESICWRRSARENERMFVDIVDRVQEQTAQNEGPNNDDDDDLERQHSASSG